MDDTLIRLSGKIETLRDQMHKRADKVGLKHPDILHLSRKLDVLIYQYLHYKRLGKTQCK